MSINISQNDLEKIIESIDGRIDRITKKKNRTEIKIDTSKSALNRENFRLELENRLKKKSIGFISKITSLSGTIQTTIVVDIFYLYYKDNKGGSGAGAEITSEMEFGQVYVCNAKGDSIKCKKYFIEKNIPEDWQESLIITEKIIDNFLQGKSGKFVRTDGDYNSVKDTLYQQFSILNKKEKIFNNKNKWTPADIYFINTSNTEEIKKTKSLLELNNLLVEYFQNKKIVGISLKKTDKSAKLEIYIPNNSKETKIIFDKEVKFFNKSSNIFSSKDIFLGNQGVSIQFRTFSTNLGSYECEIKGKNAAQGKLGGGNILKTMNNIGIKVNTSLIKDVYSEIYNDENNVGILENFYKEVKESNFVNFDGNLGEWKLKYNNIENKIKQKDWLFSKYTSVIIGDLVEKSGKTKEFFNELIGLASSHSVYSAPYVKVY